MSRSHWLRPGRALAVVVVLTAASAVALVVAGRAPDRTSPPGGTVAPVDGRIVFQRPTPSIAWPPDGEAAYDLGGVVHASPGQEAVPIASLAKLMTAYVVLRDLPSDAVVQVAAADVADTERRRARGDSVVPVVAGERLTRGEALEALLLPSANNVALMLAVRTAGSEAAFVERMNATARDLGMRDTVYTDPSGRDGGTVSTATDQLTMTEAAMRVPELARLLGLSTAVVPVAGTVRSTDTLLGQDGFVGGKTGSTSAAGGCFAFRAVRGGAAVTGVVLGQRGGPLIAAGLSSAHALADEAFAAG